MFLLRTFPSVVDSNALLASLRNPVKLFYPLAFSLCLLFAFGTHKILGAFAGRRRGQALKVVVALLLAAVILSYNYPALDGTLGLGLPNVRGNDYYVPQKYLNLPNILAGLDADYGDYRVMVFPWELSTFEKISIYVPKLFWVPSRNAMSSNVDWLNVFLSLLLKKKVLTEAPYWDFSVSICCSGQNLL